MVLSKGVVAEVQPLGKDKYGRTIAIVHVNGKSLNKELVRLGMAWWYEYFAKDDKELQRLEQDARKAKAGLWSDPYPTPPWEWQRMRKKR